MIISISIFLVLLTASGQVMLKLGANEAERRGLINGYVIVGYVLFIITILLSYQLMKIIPLKYFTVIMSVNYIAVMVASRFFLNETIQKDKLIGTLLISIGIYVFLLGS
jgi:drug/metabolite transporter (DMT)-like permease